MATYYIKPGGLSSARGTFAEPWGDLHHGNGKLLPGDQVIISGGTYNNHAREPLSVGTASGPEVVFKAAPGEVPVFSAYEEVYGLSSTPYEYTWFVELQAFEGDGYGDSAAVWLNGAMLIQGTDPTTLGPGEAYYDSSANELYVYSEDDISEEVLRVSRAAAIRLSGAGNIKLKGLHLTQSYKGLGRMSLYGDSAHVGDTAVEQCAITEIFTNAIQPMELRWVVRNSYFADIGPVGGATNFAYAFYTGSDCLGVTWDGNIIADVTTGYAWHMYPNGNGTAGHTISNNLWSGVTASGIIVAQDDMAHDITDNVFYGTLNSTTVGPLQTFGTVLRTSGNLVARNRFVNLGGWNLEDGATARTNTFTDNKVWDSGYYSDSDHSGSTHTGTLWSLTPGMVTALRFAHNGVALGSPGTNYATARASWDDNAAWVAYTDPGAQKPTYAQLLREHLAKHPDHGYLLLNDTDRLASRAIVKPMQTFDAQIPSLSPKPRTDAD